MKSLTAAQSTSLQRTYRYLRVGIAATVVVIFVAVAVTTALLDAAGLVAPLMALIPTRIDNSSVPGFEPCAAGTECVPAALQVGIGVGVVTYAIVGLGGWVVALYLTSKGPRSTSVVVSLVTSPIILIAASLGIIAISGRGVERALLDAAGLVAPLMALIPTRIDNSTVPGFEPCAVGTECVPAELQVGIGVGVVTYAIVGLGGWVVALFLTSKGPRATSVVVSLVTSPIILIAAPVLFFFWRDGLLFGGHLVAAGAFFLLIAAVAVSDDFHSDVEKRPTRRVKRTYRIIGVVMGVNVAVTIGLIIAGVQGPSWLPVGFAGELLGLALFFVFWILQSSRVWDEDEAERVRTKVRAARRRKKVVA